MKRSDDLNIVYSKKNFRVYGFKSGYVIHNTKKEFSEGHTHLKNYKTCVYLVNLSINKSIPKDLNMYFLVSLKRLANDKSYIKKLDNLIAIKNKQDRKKYYKREESL